MNSVMASGISALHGASAQAARAAAQVIEASHDRVEQEPAPEAPPASAPPPSPTVSGLETLGLIDGMVDLMRAEHAYKAGAAIIRTGDEMMEETLDLV